MFQFSHLPGTTQRTSHDYFLVFIKIFEIDTLVLIAHIQSWSLNTHSFNIRWVLPYPRHCGKECTDILHLMLTDFFQYGACHLLKYAVEIIKVNLMSQIKHHKIKLVTSVSQVNLPRLPKFGNGYRTVFFFNKLEMYSLQSLTKFPRLEFSFFKAW